jgi:O-antigen/teichoic acid export membrane protein
MTEATVAAQPAGDRSRAVAAVMRGGALSFAGGIIAAVGGFLLTLVVTRGLGPTRAGVFFVAVGLFTILSNVLELGADTGLVRTVPRLITLGRSHDLSRTVVAAVLPVVAGGVAVATVVFIEARPLANTFMDQHGTTLGVDFLRQLAPLLAVSPIFAVLIAGTRGFGAILPLVSVQNIALPLLRPLLILLLIVGGAASERAVAAAWSLPLLLALATAATIVSVQLRRQLARHPDAPQPEAWRPLAKEFWSFSTARGFAGAAEITLVWLQVLLVGWLQGPREAGIYAAAARFVTTGTLVMQATRVAIAPRVSSALTRHDHEEAETLHQTAALTVVSTSWPLYLGLAAFAPLILRLFGGAFTHGGTALTILALAMLINLGTGNVQTVLLMGGKSSWNVINTFTALGINVVLNLLLIPPYGITGAAVAWAAAIVVENVACVLEVQFLLGVRTFNRATVEAAVSSLLCFGLPGLVLVPAFGSHVPVLAAWLVISLTAYGTWAWKRREPMHFAELLGSLRPRPGRQRDDEGAT